MVAQLDERFRAAEDCFVVGGVLDAYHAFRRRRRARSRRAFLAIAEAAALKVEGARRQAAIRQHRSRRRHRCRDAQPITRLIV